MTTTDALLDLLEESEVTADDELGAVLADLQALGAGPVPSPVPELAALLVTDGRGRRRLHRRGVVVGALVALSLGTGVTAAAASPDVRDGAIGVVAAVVHVLRPPAAVQHRSPAPAGDGSTARPSAVVGARPSASPQADEPTLPAAHSSVPGSGTRAENGVRHSTAASSGHGHGRSGSAGSHDSTGRGTSSDSGVTVSESSGAGTHGSGGDNRSQHGGADGGSGGD